MFRARLARDKDRSGSRAERLKGVDQGLGLSIEPTSTPGEADLISAQTGDDRLVADVKIFEPGADFRPAL